MAWRVLPAPDDLMRSSSRNARLNAAVDRAARRVAESEAVLHAAVRTSALARQALERSRLLLAQLERSAGEERQEPASQLEEGSPRTLAPGAVVDERTRWLSSVWVTTLP